MFLQLCACSDDCCACALSKLLDRFSHGRRRADGTAKAAGGCGFRCNGDAALDKFADAIAGGTMDIEELASQGRRRAVCPYYAARAAVERADVVLVPYSCLIHRCACLHQLRGARAL